MIPRAPFSSFDGERLPGIGHNEGPPLDPHQSFRRFAWKKARAELLPRLPIEILKRRVARAKQLGLAYPQYASILLGTGRDIVGFLFTCNALGLHLEKSIDLPEPVESKLRGLERCERLLLGAPDSDPQVLAKQLTETARITFASTAKAPVEPASWPEGRTAIRDALDPLKLPSDTVVMIGTRAEERNWADAANLARFLPADQYFSA
ncbi:MAG: hypothetical protein AB8B85_20050 [Paracoccaceae bacterium]